MQYSWLVAEIILSVVVREVCLAICEKYVDEVMTTPSTSEDWKKLADGFLKKWNFPNCVAAIDGKHISIRKPASSDGLYYFRQSCKASGNRNTVSESFGKIRKHTQVCVSVRMFAFLIANR